MKLDSKRVDDTSGAATELRILAGSKNIGELIGIDVT